MDESGGLENRYGASHRGFESYSHRHYSIEIKRLEWTKAAVLSFDKGRYGTSHRGFESYSHRHYSIEIKRLEWT